MPLSPFHNAVRLAVKRALASGALVRPGSCSWCGSQRGPVHGHHEDYGRALDVIWLCNRCHKLRHTSLAHLPVGQFLAIAPAKIGRAHVAPSGPARGEERTMPTFLQIAAYVARQERGASLADLTDHFAISHRTAQRQARRIEKTFPACEILTGADGTRRWRITDTRIIPA